jgi:3-hydroxyacyl-[acyl-carrier-protein] dehydratase
MATDDSHRASFQVATDHPCLAGHFPGRPLVPGVLLLAHLLQAVESWTGAAPCVLHLPQVKFRAPLLPGQCADIELQRGATRLRFCVRRGDEVIASGEMALPA